MAVYINTTYTTGATLFATIKRLSDGYRWSVAASAFQAAPTLANSKITLTEGASEYAGSYSGSVSAIGSPLEMVSYIHDDGLAGDTVVGLGQTYANASAEVAPADVSYWRTQQPVGLTGIGYIQSNTVVWNGLAVTNDGSYPNVTVAAMAADVVNANALASDAAAEIRALVTGGAYAIQTDGSGYVKVSSGTGTGQISLTSGVASVAVASIGSDVITSTALAASAANEIADAVLIRNSSNTEGTAGIHSLTGIIQMMTESSISGTTLTITQTDGVTSFATRTLTLTPGADPVTGVT